MTNQQIETLIRHAEKELARGSFLGARVAGTVSFVLSPLVFLGEIGIILGMFAGMGWLVTLGLWSNGRSAKRDLKHKRALALWQEIWRIGVFGVTPPLKTAALLQEIGRVYERDPQGEVFPIPQAIRLVLVWQQQQNRLAGLHEHLGQMQILRDTLLEKQQLLRELGDEDGRLERTLSQLEDDIDPLKQSCNALRASCARLETIITTVDAAARRRMLHREVGELTADFSLSQKKTALQMQDEHLDVERQITREIETFLELERETDAHLREL